MTSYEVPSNESNERRFKKTIEENRQAATFSPTFSTQEDPTGFGSGSPDTANGVNLGNFVLNPETHIISIQLSWTGATGTLDIGGIVDTTANAWQGKFLHLVSGNSTAGTGVFEPQNATAFSDVAQTLNVGTTWTGATYTTGTSKDGGIVIQSASVVIDTIDGSAPTLNTIFGAKADGQFTTVKPKEGKTLTIASGGNIDITTNETVEASTFVVAQFQEDNITPDTSGSWSLVSGAGGDGLSEPIILTLNTITPQTLPTKSTVDWSKNPNVIALDRAVEFEFSNLPTTGKYEGVLVIIDIGATVGFASPIWPASVTNPPAIPITANTRVSVMLYTIDGGTVVTHATSVGSSTGGTTLSGLTIDVNKNWLAQGISNFGALTGVTSIDLDGATATIQGIKELRFFDDDPNKNIQSTADELSFNVPALDQYSFYANAVEMIRIEETVAGVYRLDMLDHTIRNAQDIQFEDTSGATVFAGTDPAIGYDSVASRLLINMPTGGELFITNNNVLGSTKMASNSLTTNILNASDVFQLGVDATVPTIAGEFRNNGTDVTVFSGAVVRNFSNIPTTTPANTSLSNLTTTSINQALLPSAADTRDFGSALLPWRITHVKQLEIITASASAPSGSSDTQISRNETGTGSTIINHFNFNVKKEAASSLSGQFDFYFDGVTPVSITKVGTLTSLDAGAVDLTSHIQLQTQSIVPAIDGRIAHVTGGIITIHETAFEIRRTTTGTNFNQFNIVKVDAAPSSGEPIADINFQLFDSPTTTTYAKMQGGIVDTLNAGSLSFRVRADNQATLALGLQLTGDDNVTGRSYLNVFARINSDVAFGFDGGGSLAAKIHPASASTTIGIVVQDNVSFTVGDDGTVAIPTENLPTGGSLTKAVLDTAFGTHKGAIGWDEPTADDGKLFVRNSDGDWYFFSQTGKITV